MTKARYNVIENINLDHCDVTYVTSPNYPDNYDDNINMTWMVTAPRGNRVVLRFMVLIIEVDHDYVTVFEGWTPEFEGAVQRLHISGSTPPRYNLTSVGSYLWLRFTSDVDLTQQGFKALLSCIPIPVVDLSLLESANLSSPFYPEQYNDNTDLLWKVKSPTGFRVVLNFTAFNTENDHDFVTLFEGRSNFFNESSLRKTLSGTPRLGSYKSIGSHMWVRFNSDDSTVLHSSSSKGFQALLSYTMAKEVLLVDSETRHDVTSPNYPDSYNSYDDILWRITAPENYRVLLHFKDFHTGDHDYVTIYEGRGPNIEESTWRSRHFGHGSQHNITSIGSYLWIRFISERNDNSDGADGFRLLVYPLPIPDITLTSIKAVNLSSPKYPGLYDTKTDIIWRVIAPSGSMVVISFIDFHTKLGSDFLTIYEGITGDFEGAVRGFRLSGESTPDNIASMGSYVWLRFTTGSEIDSCVSCSGFMATLQAIQGEPYTVHIIEIICKNYTHEIHLEQFWHV
nr:bone morphogenetic protein 1-like [Lytechinus pictus]